MWFGVSDLVVEQIEGFSSINQHVGVSLYEDINVYQYKK